jgi:hypothetical protein
MNRLWLASMVLRSANHEQGAQLALFILSPTSRKTLASFSAKNCHVRSHTPNTVSRRMVTRCGRHCRLWRNGEPIID